MWISKNDYDWLKERAERTINAEAEIEVQRQRDRDLFRIHMERLAEEASKVPALEEELKEWKQKYADEVQKRLALIEQLGNAQAT